MKPTKRSRRLAVLCVFSVVSVSAAPSARAVTFTADTLIAAGDTTYDGQDITVSGCTVTINGAHSFTSLLVTTNGVVTHTANTTTKQYWMDLTITGDVTVDLGGSITADGKGYGSDAGSGAVG